MKFPLLAVALLAVLTTTAQAAMTAAEATRQISNAYVFCQGTYALCIRAVCAPVPTRGAQGGYSADHVLCSCVVENGWSMGPAQCSARRPVKKGKFTYLMSTYSNRFNNQEKTLTCNNANTEWAWCYGAPCVVNPRAPKSATCNCPVIKSAMSTLGGKCSQKSCNLIWSAATPKADQTANAIFYAYMKKNHPNYPVNKPAKACLRGSH